MSSCSLEHRAPAWCSESYEFDLCGVFRFFFVPRSCHVDQFNFYKICVFYVLKSQPYSFVVNLLYKFVLLPLIPFILTWVVLAKIPVK